MDPVELTVGCLLEFTRVFAMYDDGAGRQMVLSHFEGSSYAATTGALLRK
jgi:hypothetical protein